MNSYYVELVWNREFTWVRYGRPCPSLGDAIRYAERTQNMGDGACVKKTRVVDEEGKVVWQHGQRVGLATDALVGVLVFITATILLWTPALLSQQIIRAKTYSNKRVEVYYDLGSQRCFAYGSLGERKPFRSRQEARNYAAEQHATVKWVLMTPSVKAEIRYREMIRKQPKEVRDE